MPLNVFYMDIFLCKRKLKSSWSKIADGAGMFLSWDNVVLAGYADNNQGNMLNLMLDKNLSADNAFSDSSVTKNLSIEENDFQIGPHPEGTPSPLKGIRFNYYQPPAQAGYYLPAWVYQVKVNNLSADADKVVVGVFNSRSVAIITRSFPATSASIAASGFDKYLFPATDKITLEVETINKDGRVLVRQNYPETLNAGANSIVINMGQ
jgi:hypothetical protein